MYYLVLISLPFFILYGTWAWGVVLKSVWLWFIVPAFAMQPITFTQAIAISAMVNIFFIKSQIATDNNKVKKVDGEIDWEPIKTAWFTALCGPWVTWLLYWFIQVIFI